MEISTLCPKTNMSLKNIVIQTAKERSRCSLHNTPFKQLPKRVVIGLNNNVILFLNAFPRADGVSDELSQHQYTLSGEVWSESTGFY